MRINATLLLRYDDDIGCALGAIRGMLLAAVFVLLRLCERQAAHTTSG